MTARKRTMKNTVQGKLEQVKLVSAKLKPTKELNEREQLLFDGITSSREKATFMDHDLWLATQLATTMAMLEEVDGTLKVEGSVIENNRGTPVMNPLFSVRTQLVAQAQNLSKILGLSASQKGLATEPQKQRNRADAEASAILDQISEDSLLA